MARIAALLTLAFFSNASVVPLFNRQADPAAPSRIVVVPVPHTSSSATEIVVVPVPHTSSSATEIVVVPVPHTSSSATEIVVVPAPHTSTVAIVTPSKTITSLPSGASLESITGTVPWTTDEWITTTSPGATSSTVVPVIFPSMSGTPGTVPIIIWGGITPPTIQLPGIQLTLPELGCIQFLGLTIGNCPSEEDPEPSKTTASTENTSKSSSSSCSSNTATITTIECSSLGSSSSCKTKTSQTVGCSVTGRLTSTGSCIASTTIASSTICCSSTSVTAGTTVCAFSTLTAAEAYPSPTIVPSSLGTAQLLSMLGSYYTNFGGGNETTGATAPSTTPPPTCTEGSNELEGVNNEPSSWCFCGGRGPFSTIDKATTSYCEFTALPTQTISLTSHSTPVDSACHVSTTYGTVSAASTAYCRCGDTLAGIGTSIIAGGTTLVGCELFPTWSIISTITPTPTPTLTPTPTPTPTPSSTSTSAPAPTAPYADQPGQCHIHVNEWTRCTNDEHSLLAEVTMWDVKGTQIGYQNLTEAGADNPLEMKSELESVLEVTGERTGDFVQFTLGTESWTSKDNDKTALTYCNTGAWDPGSDVTESPDFSCTVGSLVSKRQMDCFFQCPWHGGPSSDA